MKTFNYRWKPSQLNILKQDKSVPLFTWHLASFDYRTQLNTKNGDLCSSRSFFSFFMFIQFIIRKNFSFILCVYLCVSICEEELPLSPCPYCSSFSFFLSSCYSSSEQYKSHLIFSTFAETLCEIYCPTNK